MATAQDPQAPDVVTLVPINTTQASATLRAEVNPNGLPTQVEFAVELLGIGDPVVVERTWVVNAGDGTDPIVVEQRVGGFVPYSRPRIRVVAFNIKGSSVGFRTYVNLKGPDKRVSGEPGYYSGAPMTAHLPVEDLRERSATIRMEVNPNGFPATVMGPTLVYFAGPPGPGNLRYVSLPGKYKVSAGDGAVRFDFPAAGLYRGMRYQVVLDVRNRVSADLSLTGGAQNQFFTTPGEPGHNPPEVSNATLRVPIGSTEAYTRVVAGFDPDGDEFAILSTSTPQHGTVTIDTREWTYIPDASYDGSDQFTVTVVDTKGDQATRVVQIFDARPGTFEFDLPLAWNATIPPQPAGRLTLSATSQSAFTGRASIFGKSYPLRGSFNAFDEATLELDRSGLPPLLATLKLVPGVDGEMHLNAEILVQEVGSAYIAEGLPIGNAETSEGVAGLRYTVVLPLQDGVIGANSPAFAASATTDTPQGDGFLIGSVDKKGRAKFSGRTGDGQAFSFSGRLQRNRKLQVGISIGKQPRDYVMGNFEFNRDATRSVGGSLDWFSFRSDKEYYRNDFTRTTEIAGAAYRKPDATQNPFGEIGASADLQLKLTDETQTTVLNSVVTLSKSGAAVLSGEHNLKFSLKRDSGLFSGALKQAGSRKANTFMGALVQPRKTGQGQVLLSGPVGAVTISAPEQ